MIKFYEIKIIIMAVIFIYLVIMLLMIFLLIGVVKMNEKQMIKVSEYLNVIYKLIKDFQINSFFKVAFSSFIIKNRKEKIAFTNIKNNLIEGFFQQFHMDLFSNYDDFQYIFEAINILQENQIIIIQNGIINVCKLIDVIDDDFFKKKNVIDSLELIANMSEDSFVEEVLYNV